MSKRLKKIMTKAAPSAIGPYSQAIVVQGSHSLVFVSGQLPIDPKTGELIQGNIKDLRAIQAPVVFTTWLEQKFS